VDDLIEGLIRLMESPPEVTGPINIGNPAEFTIKALAELVIEQTGSGSELSYLPLPQDDPKQRRPDISLAKAKLNWEPQVALADGLKPTIAYFADRLQVESAKELRRIAASAPRKRRAPRLKRTA
jgi:UDP-glucuronate decarboxylase